MKMEPRMRNERATYLLPAEMRWFLLTRLEERYIKTVIDFMNSNRIHYRVVHQ